MAGHYRDALSAERPTPVLPSQFSGAAPEAAQRWSEVSKALLDYVELDAVEPEKAPVNKRAPRSQPRPHNILRPAEPTPEGSRGALAQRAIDESPGLLGLKIFAYLRAALASRR